MVAKAGNNRFDDWLDEERARARMGENEASVRKDFWRKIRRAAGQVPMVEDLVTAYYCALDRRTPGRVRAILLAALAYFIMPFDVVPDVIYGLGYTDDVTVLLAALNLVSAHIKPEHRRAAAGALDRDSP